MRKFVGATTIAAAMFGSLMFAAPSAIAAPLAPTAGDVTVLAAAPSCVNVKRITDGHLVKYKGYDVTNNCKTTKKLKGVFSGGYDSECTSVKPKKTVRLMSSQPWVGYDKVVTC
ncbi:hypothetical protein J7F02_00865 [Streptomyces sp. ISL-112]|uniref:hypothetical protein n=1 Tax=unclassified Streptomyces TaxID=2593676 RepID=UPI001BE79721|nr:MULTISPECIES: hypothetical protein [unclassified Streptomyces]MBT2424296.1 hypothetical protein [Streptomyces sp. ISL-112]MBT2463616.1 hypothetical protein [Streptomyces sp. ISL-63]